MNCVSCDIFVCHLSFCFCFFPGVFLSSGVTGAFPVTTDLIMRVDVRTTIFKRFPAAEETGTMAELLCTLLSVVSGVFLPVDLASYCSTCRNER